MKLYKLATKFHVRHDVLARYIRSLGIPIGSSSDESVPDYVLPQLEQNYGSRKDEMVPYLSASPTSGYVDWKKEIVYIFQDIIGMVSRCQFGNILDRRIILFQTVLSRIKEYPHSHPDLKEDMERIVSVLSENNDTILKKLEKKEFFSVTESLNGITENGLLVFNRLKTIIEATDERVAHVAASGSTSLKEEGIIDTTKQYEPSLYISFYDNSSIDNWINDIPLIHKDVCDLIDYLPDNRIVKDYDRMKRLLVSVNCKLADYLISNQDAIDSIRSVVEELLDDCEQRIGHFKKQYFDSSTKSNYVKWTEMVSIKSLYLAKHETSTLETSDELFIPWEDVVFDDGQITIDSQALGKWTFRMIQSRKVYNLFSRTFSNRVPQLRLRIRKGNTPEIVNTLDLDEVFLYLSIRYQIHLGELLDYRKLKEFIDTTRIDFEHEFLPKDKTPYIQFLVDHQCPQYRFVPLFETRQKHEDAFLFTIKGDSTFIVWESLNINTATYIFPIKEALYNQSLQAIYDYACSGTDSKRLRIRKGISQGAFGLATIVIKHFDYQQWTSEISRFL